MASLLNLNVQSLSSLMKSFSCASLCTSCLINELFSSGMFVMRSTGMPKVPDDIKINIFPRNTVNNLNLANNLKALHDGPTQEVLPVISDDIVNQIVAHVTQEFISQLTSLLHSISNSKPLSNLKPLEARVNQQNTVPAPTPPAAATLHPSAVAQVLPLSLAPTRYKPSLSSEQPVLSEVPVCWRRAAAVSSCVDHIYNHLIGELIPPSALTSSFFIFCPPC